jgi:hypothetical protein
MEYELIARTETSILRFRDRADPRAAETFVSYLKRLAGAAPCRVEVDLDGSATFDAPALSFMGDVQRRMRDLAPAVRFVANDKGTRQALADAAGTDAAGEEDAGTSPTSALRLSMTLH